MKYIKLNEVLEDLSKNREVVIDDLALIKEPSINSKFHTLSAKRIIEGHRLKVKKRVKIKKGDFVISTMHTQNGAFGFSDQDYISTKTFAPLRIRENLIDSQFLYWTLHVYSTGHIYLILSAS